MYVTRVSVVLTTVVGSFALTGCIGQVEMSQLHAAATSTIEPHQADKTDSSESQMPLVTFNGSSIPLNRAGDTYPSLYGGKDGGKGSIALDAQEVGTGNNLRISLTEGRLYAQFNPYTEVVRDFARDYSVHPSRWKFNTYNRFSFWIKRPINIGRPLHVDGNSNVEFGTYVKRVKNPDRYSDEAGGNHYYHMLNIPNLGVWTRVILNFHPDHRRGNSGSVDPGVLEHPTGEPEYNYFDCLTRFYMNDFGVPTTYPANYWLDHFEFYQESAPENDAQVSAITATYEPSTNRLVVTWNRAKDENDTVYEVRYAFQDVHELGWDKANRAPKGMVKPPGWQGYNGLVYDNRTLPLNRKPMVYIAIKPQKSRNFSQITLPLNVNKR